MTNSTYDIEKLIERSDIKEKIMESLNKTKEKGKEHVFNFCAKNGEIVITDIDEGKKNTVGSKCPKDEKFIGAFHTHTILTKNLDVVPSPKDIIKSAEDDLEFFCIGGIKGRKGDIGIIRCFDKNDLILEINNILEIMGKKINEENIEDASQSMVRKMLSDSNYLDEHSHKYIMLVD